MSDDVNKSTTTDGESPVGYDALINYPYSVQERAAIYEYLGNMSRVVAEAKAIEDYRKENR